MNDYSELTAARRRERTLQLLQEKEEVSVKALSKDFCVSEMTIRRDLHLLEAQGLAVVHYGGASLCNYRPMFQDFSNRQEKLYKNKLAIARTAATKIERHDTLFLDASTTILLMLRFLPDYWTILLQIMSASFTMIRPFSEPLPLMPPLAAPRHARWRAPSNHAFTHVPITVICSLTTQSSGRKIRSNTTMSGIFAAFTQTVNWISGSGN